VINVKKSSILVRDQRIILPWGTWSTAPTVSPDGTITRNVLARSFYKKLGLALALGGGDQGFNEAADVIEQTIDGVDTNELWSAYQQAVALRNREREPLINFLSWFVTDAVEGIATADSDARFERASEYGKPRSYRPAGEIEFFGYDFNWYDLGARFTWEFLADAPAAQVDAINTQALEADSILMFQLVMWTLFNPANREAVIRKKPYNVYAFWNNDGQVPPTYRTNTFAGTHTHYYTSGSTTVDSGDLDGLELKLTEHGYKGSNGYNLILMVNKEQGDIIRTFKSVQNGGTAKWDFIPAQGTPAFLVPRDYVLPAGQQAPPANIAGMEVIGRYGEFTIIQEDYIPPKYLVAFATGGQESVNNPVGLRQHANPALRGLRLIQGRRPDYPLTEAYYGRGIGSGIRKRGAGAVLQLTASGTYTQPTEYDEEP
jgi:hypothetical protein